MDFAIGLMKDESWVAASDISQYVNISADLVIVEKNDPKVADTYQANQILTSQSDIGSYGGYCICPDGTLYQTGVQASDGSCNTHDYGCQNGTPYGCSTSSGSWSGVKVICGLSENKSTSTFTLQKCSDMGKNGHIKNNINQPAINYDTIEFGYSSRFLCFPNSDYTLTGNIFSTNFQYIKISIGQCQSNCKSISEVDGAILSLGVLEGISHSHDNDEPIKYGWNSKLSYEIGTNTIKSIGLYLTQLKVEDYDNFINAYKKDYKYSIMINNINNESKIRTRTYENYINFNIYADINSTTFTRKYYSLLFCLAMLGNCFGIISFFIKRPIKYINKKS